MSDIQTDEDGQLQALRALAALPELHAGQRGRKTSAQAGPDGLLGGGGPPEHLVQRQEGEVLGTERGRGGK